MVPILSPFGCIYQTIRRGESNRMERDPIRWDSLLSIRSPLYSSSIPRETACEDIETPRPILLDGAYSIPFRLYLSDRKERGE